jgi:hypothetical protein
MCAKNAGFVVFTRASLQDNEKTQFKVKRGTKMQKIFEAYAARKGIQLSVLKFLLDGQRINVLDTPLSVCATFSLVTMDNCCTRSTIGVIVIPILVSVATACAERIGAAASVARRRREPAMGDRKRAIFSCPSDFAHAEVTKNMLYFSMGPKLRYPTVMHTCAAWD